ncbi:MAG: hypothetical protein E7658_01400 [Ruminococcaceae bacterium]|nr:hypothetical protein [Oscillospiraceae bacterium]
MQLNIENSILPLPGLEREYHFYHVSDAHFSFAEENDTEGEKFVMRRDAERYENHPDNVDPLIAWDALMEYLKNDPDADGLLITGDIFNFFNISTHNKIREMIAACPVETFYTPGNHEFCNPMDVANTKELQAMMHPTTPETDIHNIYHRYFDEYMNGNADFWVRDFGRFLLVGLNNESHDITPDQMARFREQAAKGLPILLMMHVAVRSDAYIEVIKANWVGLNMYFLFENNDSPMNKAFSDFIRSPEGNVAAVIAGHVHASHDGEFEPGKRQLVAAPLYERYVRKITVVPC